MYDEHHRSSKDIAKQHALFCSKFSSWEKPEIFPSAEEFRVMCKYDNLSAFEKDCVDEYISGRLEIKTEKEVPAWMI